jgi:hypothetical protein
VISLVSVVLALAAVGVSSWQVRASIISANKANALPVVSEAFREWRSPHLNDAFRNLLTTTEEQVMGESFEALPPKLREDAYEVCTFFDYLGTLVLHGIVNEDVIVGGFGTRIVQVWKIMEPLIWHERKYREDHFPPGTPKGFMEYYEHLVKLTEVLGGENAGSNLRQRAGALHLVKPSEDDLARMAHELRTTARMERGLPGSGGWRNGENSRAVELGLAVLGAAGLAISVSYFRSLRRGVRHVRTSARACEQEAQLNGAPR